jgi:hypothetical protein
LKDYSDEDDNSDDENLFDPLVNDEEAETFIQDLRHLFNSNMMDSPKSSCSYMTNISLDESKLINAPNVISFLLIYFENYFNFYMESRLKVGSH